MPSSGTCHCVGLVRTDVLEECITCIFRAKGISELATTLAVSSSFILYTLKMYQS
jgi:hypothetical protein